MKFRNISNAEMAGVYGYRFRPGEEVEVHEDNLIAKFKNYGWLEVVEEKPVKKVKKKAKKKA